MSLFSITPPRPTIERTVVIGSGEGDPLGRMERLVASTADGGSESGWLMMLGYELGGVIEPKAGGPPGPGGAMIVLQRWTRPGNRAAGGGGGFELGPLRSSMGRARYMAAAERTLGYIASGDIYQANIAHCLSGSFAGSVDSFARAMFDHARPRYGAAMVFDHEGRRHAVVSVSPELFLRYDPATRVLRTEPMKGTRPLGCDARELRDAPKDKAELDMITDLMRNDLGRVCVLGSVRVVDPRRIEAHGSGVLQASSIVEGLFRRDQSLGDLVRATFPPGSVTGAPKVRAMQVIAELEGRPRGPYCGSLLSIRDDGAIEGSVAIRTAHIVGEPEPGTADGIAHGCLDYSIGAGIVADSDPASEWAETLTKAQVLRDAVGAELVEPDAVEA